MAQRKSIPILVLVGMMVSLSTVLAMAGPPAGIQPAPRVVITTVPPYDPVGGPHKTAAIAGNVSGMGNCPDCRVVIFAHTDRWYVQPFVSSPFTTIERGRWQAITHLGAEYTALLVRAGYRPPATTDALPNVGRDVLAITTVPGSK